MGGGTTETVGATVGRRLVAIGEGVAGAFVGGGTGGSVGLGPDPSTIETSAQLTCDG